MFINTPEDALRIVHKLGSDVRLPVMQRLTMLEDWPEDLRSSQISLQEAEKELKSDAKVYLYLVKEFEGDSDEDFSSARDHQVDLCFVANPMMDLAKKKENSS